MEFKDRLKKLRTEQRMSQQALADAIFVSRSAVAKWEAGLGLPSVDSMQMLADYFGLPVEQLYAPEPKVFIPKKSRWPFKQTRVIAGSAVLLVLILLLCVLSVPRVHTVITADCNSPVSPYLSAQYNALAAEYTDSGFDQISAGKETVVTVKNLWGSWSCHILPVYHVRSGAVPRAGQDIWSAELRMLTTWTEENMFTYLCKLKLQDLSFQLDTNDTVVLGEKRAAYHTQEGQIQDMPISHLMEPDDLRFTGGYDFGKSAVIDLSWYAGTAPFLERTNQVEIASYSWQYTLRLCGKTVVSYDDTVTRVFIANAV